MLHRLPNSQFHFHLVAMGRLIVTAFAELANHANQTHGPFYRYLDHVHSPRLIGGYIAFERLVGRRGEPFPKP